MYDIAMEIISTVIDARVMTDKALMRISGGVCSTSDTSEGLWASDVLECWVLMVFRSSCSCDLSDLA